MDFVRVFSAAVFLSGVAMAQQAPTISGCPAFPANSIWNTAVDTLPVSPHSADYISNISSTGGLRYDISIPINIVPGSQPMVPMYLASGESDPGPYPFPPNAQVESGSDAHVIVVDKDNCVLYETYNSSENADGSWNADIGAKWSLLSNALRTDGYSSADAAGLPILPGLLRYDEMMSGQINHALRFTAPHTQRAYVWPGRHYASSNTSTAVPPMAQRFRLKASFDISGFSAHMQVILRAIKKYGLILADNGLPWEMQASLDTRWDENDLLTLRQVVGSNLEAVDVSGLMIDWNSGQAVQGAPAASAALSSVSLGATSVTGGSNVSVTVNLTAAAPAGGALVSLTGSNGAFPAAAVTVAAGQTSQTFSVPTAAVTAATSVIITASYNGAAVQAPALTVNPVAGVPPGPGGSASFVKSDTATAGWWRTAYGADGYNVINDSVNYPSYVTVTPAANLSYVWAGSTADPRALQKGSSSTDRIAACWYNGSSFSIDLNFQGTTAHQTALYLLDWDTYQGGRNQRVDVVDGNGNVLDSRTVSGFTGGQYLVWNLSGHVIIRLTNLVPNANAVVSGLFFGGAAGNSTTSSGTAAFVKTDTTTSGYWRGTYGNDGYSIIGDTASIPSYVTATPASNYFYVWAGSTSDTRAPYKGLSFWDRIAACWYHPSTFTVDLSFHDTATHQVALYFLDWDKYQGGRVERVDIVDSNNNLLDSRTISGFTQGQYLVWNLSGHVIARITNVASSANNAVVSAVLFR